MIASPCEILIIKNKEENKNLLRTQKLDKFDVLSSTACGAVSALVDFLFVGIPGNSKLQNFTDSEIDKLVVKFANRNGYKGNKIEDAIATLEKKYKVGYDQTHSSAVKGMNPSSHHMMSLGHSPSIVGLFFSVLNQFTGTSSFVSGGKYIKIDGTRGELVGSNFFSKLFAGVTNWFGHLMSDIAGSSSSRAKGAGHRGMGIVMPFYELFGFCADNSRFSPLKGRVQLNDIALQAFENGYDARFGFALSLPVALCELLIRLIWSIRRFFVSKYSLIEAIPIDTHKDLCQMLLIGHATFAFFDLLEAGVKSKFNFYEFFIHLNYQEWLMFGKTIIKNLMFLLNVYDIDYELKLLREINIELDKINSYLGSLDLDKYESDVNNLEHSFGELDKTFNYLEFRDELIKICESNGWNKPWEGDFDSFMENKNNTLIFK